MTTTTTDPGDLAEISDAAADRHGLTGAQRRRLRSRVSGLATLPPSRAPRAILGDLSRTEWGRMTRTERLAHIADTLAADIASDVEEIAR